MVINNNQKYWYYSHRNSIKNDFKKPSAIPTATIGRGGGLEVSIVAFYFDNLSLNLADYKKFMSRRQEKTKKTAGSSLVKISSTAATATSTKATNTPIGFPRYRRVVKERSPLK